MNAVVKKKKAMKQLLPFLSCCVFLFLSSCTKEKDGILVKFINLTGDAVLEAKANDQLIGDLDANSATNYIEFSNFGMDTGMPDIPFTGKFNGTALQSTSGFYWCGTEKSGLPPGKYTVGIHTVDVNGTVYFNLRFQ